MSTNELEQTDRIEKHAVLRAPRSRVWAAIVDSAAFGRWFGATFDGPFVVGAKVPARITDPPEHAGTPFEVWIERIEPERLLAFRWPAHASGDAPSGVTTLVEIRLADAGTDTALTITESGFDALEPGPRAALLRTNDSGWEQQLQNIARHVAR